MLRTPVVARHRLNVVDLPAPLFQVTLQFFPSGTWRTFS